MPKPFIIQDHYFNKAKQEGYRARSVYKLIEIDSKFNLIKKNQSILDLGCAPGSWTQYIVDKTKNFETPNSKIIGIDLQETIPIKGANTYICDIFEDRFTEIIKYENIKEFDIILSDMAPKTSGINDVDQYASIELNLEVLKIVKKYLKNNGSAVFKIFQGADFNDFWFEAKKLFKKIKTFKPKACRERSFEIYCVGTEKME